MPVATRALAQQKANDMTDVAKQQYRKYLPEGIAKEPETVLEALTAARAILVEEGRWLQGEWFVNNNPDLDPEDPFCNGWGVCAEGAVAMVTIGVKPCAYNLDRSEGMQTFTFDNGEAERDYRSPEAQLYRESNEQLRVAAAQIMTDRDPDRIKDSSPEQLYDDYGYESAAEYYDSMIGAANEFNDNHCETRTEAVAWFDKAIANQSNSEQEQAHA